MTSIDEVRDRILADESRRNWSGYVHMLKILKKVFQSPDRWILEFLQNAEDAKARRFLIQLGPNYIHIFNDGDPFGMDDIDAICDVNSRKIPSLGFKGYLGIGFKSIFKVSRKVEVHSGDLHFKFDRDYWKDKGENWPWEILPVNAQPRQLPEGFKTGFIVNVEGDSSTEILAAINEFLSPTKFPKEALLTLQRVVEVRIDKQPDNTLTFSKDRFQTIRTTVSGREIDEDTVTLQWSEKYYTSKQSYRVFRTVVHPPVDVRTDEETIDARRENVNAREVGVIFPLDDQGRFQQYRGTLAGVYSFLPLQTEQTGVPFSIIGDFIPQPGRDLIHYGARWNVWMCNEVQDFLRSVIRSKVGLEESGQDFLISLHAAMNNYSTYGPGQEFWEKHLRTPLLTFLTEEPLYRDVRHQMVPFKTLVAVPKEITEIIGTELTDEFLLDTGRHRVDPVFQQHFPSPMGVYDLLRDFTVLGPNLKSNPAKLTDLYRLITTLSDYYVNGRDGRDQSLSNVHFVLGEDGTYHPPSKVATVRDDLPDIPSSLHGFLKAHLNGKILLHPLIAANNAAVGALQRCGLTLLDLPAVIEWFKGLVESASRTGKLPETWGASQLVEVTLWLLKHETRPFLTRLVAQDGTFQDATYLFVPKESLDWEPLQQVGYLPGYLPVNDRYLDKTAIGMVRPWFQELRLHGFDRKQDDPLIKKAAEEIGKRKLSAPPGDHKFVGDPSNQDLKGFDLECSEHCQKVFEVKGMTDPRDILLEPSEVLAAQERSKNGNYMVYVVYHLPRLDFTVKSIPNPQDLWVPIEKARIPVDKWMGS